MRSYAYQHPLAFALTLIILISGSIILGYFIKIGRRITSIPDQNAGKFGTPYQFIGSDFIYQKYKNLLFAGSTINEQTTDIAWKFMLSNTVKDGPKFEVLVEYRIYDVAIEVTMKDGDTTNTIRDSALYDKEQIQSCVLKAINRFLMPQEN